LTRLSGSGPDAVVARLRVCHGPAVLGGRGALAAVRARWRRGHLDPWSSPYDRPVAATYAALTAAGAQRVVLLGASQGAALALAIAPALDPRPAGVVSLSAVAPHPGADRDVRRPRPVHV